MPQTNYTPIQLYRSTTPAATPATGNMEAGELAINIADGRLYYEKTGPAIAIIGAEMTSTVATFLGTPSSANLIAAVSDETGTGALVFATSPTLVTPALGTPASGNLSNCTASVAYGFKTASTTVSVSGATAPTSGQTLIATSSTNATWQTVASTLNTISAAVGTASLSNSTYGQIWNWALTGASEVGFTFGETSASTGGSGSQDILKVRTVAASTANPLRVQTRAVDTILVSRTGDVTITALNGTTGSGTTGSVLTFAAGQGASTSTGGALTITSGAGGSTSGGSGAMTISTGAVTGGASPGSTGVLTISTPNVTGASAGSGNISITTGSATAGDSGNITLTAGNGQSGQNGGNITLDAGNATSGGGGQIRLIGANTGAVAAIALTSLNVANGSVATTITSLGPTGASTTIQGWIAVDIGGVARYIPFW